ncbi:MAG: flippase-like domain-containing protein [Chloroflexi bacterium]|nr:flippase-like domain-containing protein [Chloroflexota bacterium]
MSTPEGEMARPREQTAAPNLLAAIPHGAKPSLYWLLFLLFAGLTIAFLLTRFDVDASAVWRTVRTADPWRLFLAVVFFYLGLLLRGWRWRAIWRNASPASQRAEAVPGVVRCTRYVVIGRFIDSVSWLRVGNFYRAYVASTPGRAAYAHVFGTILGEHILDALAVSGAVILIGALVIARQADLPVLGIALASALSVAAIGIAVFVMARFGPPFAARLPGPVARTYLQLRRGTLSGLSMRRMPFLLLMSALVWACAFARWYFVIAALGGSASFPLVLFLSVTNALIAAIPATPAGLGLVEPGATAVLLIELALDDAIAITVAERAISYVSLVIVGGAVFFGGELVRPFAPKGRRWSKTG